jgi:choline kinase
MNTIAKRRELLNIQMRDFEKGKEKDYAWIAGFYAGIIESLASDRPADYEFVMNMLKRNS